MKRITNGTEILFNNIHGKLIKYNETEKKLCDSESILFAEKLTNDLAIYALNSGAQGIITRRTSFAAHGANILRGSNVKIAWVTNVDLDTLIPYINSYIYVDTAGNIYALSEINECTEMAKEPPKETMQYNFLSAPLNDTSVVDFNLSTGEQWICYWKYNYFSGYIYESLSVGIQCELMELFGSEVDVKRDENGRIWVRTDVSHSKMLNYCCDSQKLLAYLDKVKVNYNQLLESISNNKISMSILQQWFIKYFSTFTLFHRSYDYVLYKLYEMVLKEKSTIAVDFMDFLMNSKIDNWLVEKQSIINHSKAFMVPEPVLPMPSFTIEEDIEAALYKTECFFANYNLFDWYKQNNEVIKSRVILFVIKEWKFVIYKLLTSRCYLFYSKCENLDLSTVAESSYSELEVLYGEREVIVSCD